MEEGGDKDKCFVQQMLPAMVASVALAVGEVMKGFPEEDAEACGHREC